MAGASSSRDLWQSITGVSILRPPELIQDELQRNQERLIKGLEHYKPAAKNTNGARLKRDRKLQGPQLEFALKISKFLGLDELQSYDLFCSYLLHDYRGSKKDLQMLLGIDRHAAALLLKVRDYFYAERLYLLRCIKQLLSFWQEEHHPYREQYAEFVEEASKMDKLSKGIQKQYLDLCDMAAPNWETHGQSMNERQAEIWMTQNLKEQCELLEILLLFYRSVEHQAVNLLILTKAFKRQGFGKRQVNKHLLEESSMPILKRIGYLQVVLLVEGMDLEYLLNCNDADELKQHHIISSKEYKELTAVLATLGDLDPHGPVLLAWTLLRQLDDADDAALTNRMGNAALQLNVFRYLTTLLETEPFSGQTTVATVSQTVLYGLVSLVLKVFEEDTLGDSEGLYRLSSRLLQQTFKDSDFGLRMLLKSSLAQFPFRFEPLLQLLTALAKSGPDSASKVFQLMQNLTMYTENLEHNSPHDIAEIPEEDVWVLTREKRPYPTGNLFIRKGTRGRLDQNTEKHRAIIVHWSAGYDGWKICEGEILRLQEQVAQGAGMVPAGAIARVTQVVDLCQAVMTSNPELTPELKCITSQLPFIIERFSLVQSPPLYLLSKCIEAMTCAAVQRPAEVWHQLQQTRLLPYMTENFDDYHEAASGSGLNAGSFGSLLAGYECTQGTYPLTVSVLKLVTVMIQPLHKEKKLEDLMASVVFITREIFPAFHKWRYYDLGTRELVGQKCLEIFHKILNILDPPSEGKKIHLRDVCVHCLLYTESGRALLDIVSTGVDVVEATLAQQGSAMEGLGVEVIQLIRLALSVLNRLLLLRPHGGPASPVEHALSAKPANYTHRHVVAVIAQYIYHRHDARLPTLATLLLKRLSMVFPMSILACLGNDAEAIRDMYLARLQASTEDIRLKVVLLEFLAVCVEMQPGLTEMFLNVQTVKKDGKTDIAIGRTSCLQTVLNLIDERNQGTYQCPYDLLCAAMEFIHALWEGQRDTVMAILREKDKFWGSVCLSLMRDLPEQGERDFIDDVLDREIKTCARILSIMGHEMYVVPSDKLDKNLKKVLGEVSSERRIQYWSKYLCSMMKLCSCSGGSLPESLADSPTLQLLLAWRNFLLVTATYKPECLKLGSEVKITILKDILDGLEAQFTNGMTALSIQVASVASALYFTQLKHWVMDIRDPSAVVQQLEHILTLTCANSETLIPSVQIGILGSLTLLLQQNRTSKGSELKKQCLNQLVPVVCSVLQQSTYQLPLPAKVDPQDKAIAVKLKLQMVTICLVQELVLGMDNCGLWMTEFQHHSILPALLASLQAWIQAKKAPDYVHALITFFIALAKIPQSAESLAVNGLTRHLCLVMSLLYEDDAISTTSVSPAKKLKRTASSSWQALYCHGLSLVTLMLASLRYNFLQEALDFVGVHQDRMYQCLESLRSQLAPSSLEEVEQTCLFLHQMSHYEREWRLHLPDVLRKLKASVCYLAHSCVSMLIRPRLLTHMMQKQSGLEPGKLVSDRLRVSPAARQLSHQSSADDAESMTPELLRCQERVLEVLSYCLATMRQFSPNLREILLDQSMDVSEYEPILLIGFSTPSMDQDSPPTFGTLVAGVNTCLRLLGKLDPRSTSPVKSPQCELLIKRATVMFVMESGLHLIMSQAVRYLREGALAPREKQLLRRELSAELSSFLMSMQRHLRRGPTSPAAGSAQTPGLAVKPSSSQLSFTSNQEQGFFRLVDNFVQNVLK